MTKIKQGQYVYVDLGNDHQYCEQAGVRPALVVSSARYNSANGTIVIVPITSRKPDRNYKTSLSVPEKDYFTGTILLQHIRAIDKKRVSVSRKYGQADPSFMHQIKKHLLRDVL